MLKEHITSGLYIAPGNRTHAADEKDYDSWTTEAVAEELAPLGTTTLERSRRHGLSNVVISLHALPPKQHLAIWPQSGTTSAPPTTTGWNRTSAPTRRGTSRPTTSPSTRCQTQPSPR